MHPDDPTPAPAFSPSEMALRRARMTEAMEGAGVAHLVAYGADRSGNAVQWLCGWPVTREAALLVTPGEQDVLLVQFYNHVPNARRIARDADVRWGGPSTVSTLAGLLRARGAGRVGTVGPLTHRGHEALSEGCGELVSLDGAYRRMRMTKSAEEVEWLRRGAELSDRAVAALTAEARPGLTEWDLAAIVEGSYLPHGGTNHIHYFGVSSMEDPSVCVPAQYPTHRRLRPGDVLFTEISASYWGYTGQVLRTFTLHAEPTPLYRSLHEAAEQAFHSILAAVRPGAHASELVEASGVIEEMGFTTYDDLVHGYGGGYLPPVLGSRSRQNEPVPDLTLEEGMAIVIQPNVVTTDERAGVQTGELVLVTRSGAERLHTAPEGMRRLP